MARIRAYDLWLKSILCGKITIYGVKFLLTYVFFLPLSSNVTTYEPMATNEIPKFLVSRRYISVVISFIVLFSALFLTLYQPFSLAIWFSTHDVLQFSFTLLFYVAAIVILIISRILMYTLQDRVELTTMTYLWWIMCENLAISLLYTVITVNLFPQPGVATPTIAVRALLCVTLILAIPNGLISLYAAYRTKCEELIAAQYQLQRLGEEYRLLENSKEHELRAAANISPSAQQHNSPKMVHLYDNSGTLRLTINIDSLYYLESEDNYIKVYYKHNDKIASYMLRCKTRTIEQTLEGTSMVRCHRSYIVNLRKVKVVEEERRLHFVTLDDDSIRRIPVSKSYYDNFVARLSPEKSRA